ncbi:retinoid-inducible serine carboxypeptidase-like [Phymastichus coffea]|uniref:retinoid-inducible serine carboxypeptidase-like n=1 Tax=Phymastichus coffea TaxID=108790 RepID=UPI00273CDEB4|nr:retinoid-inducible serine carboxypeptidase-like [Phymastichus coffea]
MQLNVGKQGFGPGDQEWGYVTVRPKAHMFWWLYYTTANVLEYEDKPLIIWLQGGPGVSGTGFGNFEELGPLNTQLKPRNHTWVKDYNVVFIDNPVGTGFSYVESLELLVNNNEQIAKDLMYCVKEFFKKFPNFSKTPTYILAESYGGKMTVEFAYLWYHEQVQGRINSNFQGIGLVDSLISSNDMYASIASYLFNFGLIDTNGYKIIANTANQYIKSSNAGDWSKALYLANEIEYLMQNQTYRVDRYNVIKEVKLNYYAESISVYNLSRSLYSDELKKTMKMVMDTLDLESIWGVQEIAVNRALYLDSRKPVVHYVEKLLNETNIKVFVFNGQLDLIINTPGTLSWIEKLNWKYSDVWLKSKRLPLVVNNIIEGYSKGYGNFKFYWVNRSGHMIPADNPVAMESILRDLIYS